MSARVVGLDLSLTSAGMSDGVRHRVVQTDTSLLIEERFELIRHGVENFALGADLAVIESSAYSRNRQPGHEELAGLRLMVRHLLWSMAIPYGMMTPSALKLYTAGSGKATKRQMLRALNDRHGIDMSGVKVKDGRYDMVDAAALAAVGYVRCGQPLSTVGPPAPAASFNSVKWYGGVS